LNEFIEGAKSRVSSFGVEAKTNPKTLSLAAESQTEIDLMWNTIESNINAMMACAEANQPIEVADRTRYRYQVSTVNDRCVSGAFKLVKASGGCNCLLRS
jgi:hypothetical protein